MDPIVPIFSAQSCVCVCAVGSQTVARTTDTLNKTDSCNHRVSVYSCVLLQTADSGRLRHWNPSPAAYLLTVYSV
jgi:hypothetical protein